MKNPNSSFCKFYLWVDLNLKNANCGSENAPTEEMMRPMSLYESGESHGKVSLAQLFDAPEKMNTPYFYDGANRNG